MNLTSDGIKESLLRPGQTLPLVIEAAGEGDLSAWVAQNRDAVDKRLLTHGGILFRGFGITEIAQFERFIAASCGEALEYKERSSPRSEQGKNVYTSTDYPPRYPIFQHNENSYARSWPMRLLFYCHIEPEQGGETPIADSRRIYQHLDPDIRAKFIEKKVLYVRNYSAGIGLPWQTVFQTSDRAEAEAYCRMAGYDFEWMAGDRLRTRRVGQAVAKHPQTGEPTWFNHATFFHVSTLVPAIREALLVQFKEEELPNNTYYGDGSPIEPEVLDKLRAVYEQETVRFTWRKGDILLLDNMFASHGRAPYKGQRKIIVGMSQAMTAEQLDAA